MILNKADSVHHILTKHPKSRDNDRYLIATTWVYELRELGHDIDKITAREFLRMFTYSKILTAAETIRRCRQKLQEHNLELRGERYSKRQDVLEPEVRHEMRNN